MEIYSIFIYPFFMKIYFNCINYFSKKSNDNLLISNNIMIQTSINKNIKNSESKFYLFCYGSNNTEQIQKRLELNEKIIAEKGYLKNYIRIFAGKSERWNGGIASIYSKIDSNVYGILVKLSLEEIEKLDKFEGGYERKKINIIKQLDNNLEEIVESYVYIKNNQKFEFLPSNQYLQAIRNMLDERKNDNNNKENINIYGLKENEIKKIGIWNKKYGIELVNY